MVHLNPLEVIGGKNLLALVVFLTLRPVAMLKEGIDEQIIKGAKELHDLDIFHCTRPGDVHAKVELDMMMTLDKYRSLSLGPEECRRRKRAIRDVQVRWTKGLVFYQLPIKSDNSSTKILKVLVEDAIRQFKDVTCLSFTQSSTAANRIVFTEGPSCWSHIGMIGGTQTISLVPECLSTPVILHMIGHSLGLLHSHNRPDRDLYVKTKQYDILNSTFISTYGISHDYLSVMHFSQMITTDSRYQNVIGRAKNLSFKDIKLINLMYLCARMKRCKQLTCPHNGFVMAQSYKNSNPCECWCDSGNIVDPLVLCSTITAEITVHNLLSSSTADTPKFPECADVRENCVVLKQRGMCIYELAMMMALCPVTCTFCERRREFCIDTEETCSLMANAGACNQPGLNVTMQRVCPKSCGVCKATQTYCDIERVIVKRNRFTGDASIVSVSWAVLVLAMISGIMRLWNA